MISAKPISPAGGSRNIPGSSPSSGRHTNWHEKLMHLFRSVRMAISGDSTTVMDNCIQYHREHRGN